jgi:hypothetical protein
VRRALDWLAFRAEAGVVVLFAVVAGVFLLWAATQIVGQAQSHDWYTGLTDRYGISCCGGNDCAPYEYRRSPGGLVIEALMPDGSWLPIPADVILPMGPMTEIEKVHVCCSPSHCRSRHSRIRCAIVPGFGA